MATLFSNDTAGLGTTPTQALSGAVVGGRLRRFRSHVTLASQPTTDDILLARVPAGAAFAFGVITTDTSLGTSTVAVGITGTTGKYRAAAVFTSVNTPTLFGLATAIDNVPLAAPEDVLLTIATAALPASGNLVVDLYFSAP
jgi:hypothetical protein